MSPARQYLQGIAPGENMFGTRRFENPYDPDDDGRDLEITPEEEAASDDQGRAEAETLLGQMGRKERNQNDRNFRRWLLRLAKKALAEGAERRRIARKKEKARAAAEAEAARQTEEDARKAEKSKRAFQRYYRESDERWAQIDEETRAANAAWEADRPAREAAQRVARTNTPPAGVRTTSGTNRAATRGGGSGPHRPSTTATLPAPKAAVNPTTQPQSAPLGAIAGSPMRRQAPATATPKARAADGQPRTESAHSRTLNPPPKLPTSVPPSVTQGMRTASSSARPGAAAPAPPIPSRPKPTQARQARPSAPTRVPIPPLAVSQPLPPPPPPSAPATPEPPPFTGADLATYRRSLGLSQGALAERLGTTQGTVSKAEGNPAALLGPTLRRAMWEAQRGAGGARGARHS